MAAITRTLRSQTRKAAISAASLGLLLGCGADFDTQDKVSTLRVFAVQSDAPYAAPTLDPSSPSQVHLTMLSHNALPEDAGALPVQRLWFSGCDDLPGDQYFTCLARMAALWKLYATPGRLALKDGESWSPVDDLPKDLSPGERNNALLPLLQMANPTLPVELAESYFNTFRIGAGERFTYPIPPLIVENHKNTDPGVPPYGLAFVFFTACAGHVDLAPEWANLDLGTNLRDATLGFPLVCRSGTETNPGEETLVPSGTGNQLDSDYFVGGYAQQFVYSDPSVNKNPVIDGVTFADYRYRFDLEQGLVIRQARTAEDKPMTDNAGQPVWEEQPVDSSVACFGGNCVPELPPAIDCASSKAPKVKACRDHCPSYELHPNMTEGSNNDTDTFSSQDGTTVGEQMWIDYYADRGEFDGTAKSLRDATLGWLPATQGQNIGDKWKPPADPGPVLLWAVVHDSRSGAAWLRLQVCVTE